LRFSPLRLLQSDHRMVRFFASVELTVILLAAIGLACIIGTLIPQADSVGGSPENVYLFYVNRHGPHLHVVFNTLSLYRLYSSWWFSALLAALTMNMIVCGFRRLRRRWRQVGFLLTHLSIVFLLAGVLVGLNRRGGTMQIFEGEQSDTLYSGGGPPVPNSLDQARQLANSMPAADSRPPIRLHFALHLDDFELRRHREPLDTIAVQSAHGGPIHSYNMAFQKKIPRAAGEPWDIEILDTTPVRRRVLRVVENTTGTLEPAIEIEFVAHGERHSDWVFARGDRWRRVLTDEVEIEYHRSSSRGQLERLLGERAVATTVTADCIEVTGLQADATTLPLRLAAEQPIFGTSLTLTVLRFVPHWQMDLETRQIISASPERRNPAVQVRVRQGSTSATQWLFSRVPSFHGQSILPGVPMQLRFIEADLRRPHFLRVLAADDSGERFVQRFLNGQIAEMVAAVPGRRIAPTGEVEVTLVRWLEHAAIESEEQEDLDHFLAHLRIRHRATGRTEEIEAPSGEVLTHGRLRLLLDREYPIDQFISHVRVVENGQTVLNKTVQMNDPLKYRGYTFYQSSYDVEADAASRYTVLSAKRDPGVGLIYLGFAMLTLGLVIVFYVNPWVGRRTKEVGSNGE